MKKILLPLFCVLFLLLASSARAATGDTVIVKTHDSVLIKTNPSVGNTTYKQWGIFPSTATKYNKVLVKLSFRCPRGLKCGEWDYLNHIYLRRKGGVNEPSQDIELMRYITPYGWNFTQQWKFDWYADITDYAILLHDSVEIEYRHTGYEANTDRGWLIDVTFITIEGQPAAEPIKIEKLYSGSFQYGKTADPIEDHLDLKTVVADTAAEFLRFRLNVTGHGAENSEGCSEFCNKYIKYLWDSQEKTRWQIWKPCGANPLYPQAGTWVYDRANWCPGDVVPSKTYDFPVAKGSTHYLDIDMENFTMPDQSNNANYVFEGVMIHYKKPNFSNDAAVTNILAPSKETYNGRLNPICANPKIEIKNNGATNLTALVINYGIENSVDYVYYWSGNLAFNQTAIVDLPYLFINTFTPTNSKFYASVSSPNSLPDENTVNDRMTSDYTIPPVYDTLLIFKIKANKDSTETSYTLKDDAGNVLYGRQAGTFNALVTYTDTFRLPDGCYELTVNDAGGDGLSWWANTAAGNGSAILYRGNNSLLKTLSADFGSITQWRFMVGYPFLSTQNSISNTDKKYLFDVYPNPAKNEVNVEVAFEKNAAISIALYDVTGREIYTAKSNEAKYHHHKINTTAIASGMYIVKVTSNNNIQSTPIWIQH